MKKENIKIKQLARLLFAVYVVLFMSNCAILSPSSIEATDLGVYPTNLPDEQQCILRIDTKLRVKRFDGQKVGWRNKNSSSSIYLITIPAGHHTFVLNYEYSMGYGRDAKRYWKNNLELEYDFKAGMTYLLDVAEGDGDIIGLGERERIIKPYITMQR